MSDDSQDKDILSPGLDRPLDVADALEKDLLHRIGFARQVVHALDSLSNRSSLVVSVEGAWGSGKTSVLSMVEALLKKKGSAPTPVIVRFNPWLVGDRDALLHQFLASVSKAIKLSDRSESAKKAAKEIDAYSKLVGLAKWIPGAEPFASIVKSLLDALGKVAKHEGDRASDIEDRKRRVEEALKAFAPRVIVLMDDVDRLYPNEVFEMIRIIKAVADLPNVGYVVTLDPAYVSNALHSLGVPKAHAYLDKIIQTRLAVPMLSSRAKLDLISLGFKQLPSEASQVYFPGNETLLAEAYQSGLRDLLEQPRDFVRLSNAVRPLEAELRGEVAFADILALAAISIKATPVYELLRRFPGMFVGPQPMELSPTETSETVVRKHQNARQTAYDQCESPDAVKRLVHFLFPQVAKDEGGLVIAKASLKNGRLAHPSRLVIALQLALTGTDVSFQSIRKYVDEPGARSEIANHLTVENCLDFLESLSDFVANRSDVTDSQLDTLAIDVARLVDSSSFAERRRNRQEPFDITPWAAAIQALVTITRRRGPTIAGHIASIVASDEYSLSAAANLVLAADDRTEGDPFHIPAEELDSCRREFAKHVVAAAAGSQLFLKSSADYILYCLAKVGSPHCKAVYEAISTNNRSLDQFALALLRHSFDSVKGQTFSLPTPIEVLTAYVPLDEFTNRARLRLADTTMEYPTRAAWECVIKGKPLNAEDGSEASR